MDDLRALSVRQPWVWAFQQAGKRIENRSRKDGRMPDVCRYRGPLLIHAASTCTEPEWKHATDYMTAIGTILSPRTVPPPNLLLRGGIVGQCRAIGHIRPDGLIYEERGEGHVWIRPSLDRRWWTGGYGLILADVEPLPFIPWKGRLGIFRVPSDYAARFLHAGGY